MEMTPEIAYWYGFPTSWAVIYSWLISEFAFSLARWAAN